MADYFYSLEMILRQTYVVHSFILHLLAEEENA